MNAPEVPIRARQALGDPGPRTLVDARLQLHWAAQVAASVGYTFINPEPDYGHLSLAWIAGPGLLASRLTAGDRPFRAALRPADLTLFLLDRGGRALGRFALDGHTLDGGYAWLASAIGQVTGTPPSLVRPDHALPPHAVAEGAPFSLDPPRAFAEMARWYAHAARILASHSAVAPNASPVRCWPHHFDIATLFQYDPGEDPEKARSIGVGLSPGDGSYAEPYWYVLPWPPPRAADLPALGGPGAWHTAGFVGAVLPASRLVDAGDLAAQERRVDAFIRSRIAAARAALKLGG